jgi:tryptophan-rich sensory protein
MNDNAIRALSRTLAPDILGIAAPLAVAGIGGVVTVRAIPTWYRSLDKPAWNPPDAVFGPVWTVLYLLMGVAFVVARRAAPQKGRRLGSVYGLQLALNLAWSLVFFGRRDTRAGLVTIVLLWVAIVATIAEFSRARRLAAALLVPYLAWVSLATLLNEEIWRANRA